MIARDDTALAKELGTNRKGLGRWRARYEESPASRDVAAWLEFMESNRLGPFSPQRNFGEDTKAPLVVAKIAGLSIPVSKFTAAPGECIPPCSTKCLQGEALATALPLDLIFDSYLENKIDSSQLRTLAPATLLSVMVRAQREGLAAQIAPYVTAWKAEIGGWIGDNVFSTGR